MKTINVHLLCGSTFHKPADSEAFLSVRMLDIHHSDIPQAIRLLPKLIDAAALAQCECTPSQRNSGHKLDCWFPALQEILDDYRRMDYQHNHDPKEIQ